MCGISGIVTDRLAADVARDAVQRMNEAQRHRGPDGDGIWSEGNACLGHRRLSIIDLSEAGRQPMQNEDGSLVLACNGEIYNYRELRSQLAGRGHRFRSKTDVETILHLYEDYGDECLQYLVGMFAFALWDGRRRRLLLARDRVGEKPLYYAATSEGLVFASEVSALLTFPAVDRSLDPEAVKASLIYPSCPAPLTMFAGIRALPPASRLVWASGGALIERYWRINCSAGMWRLDERDAAEELDARLEAAVRGALAADVPVGVLLSGGVDSGAIAAHAVRTGAGIQAFSVGNESSHQTDPDLDRARMIARGLSIPHIEIPFGTVDLAQLPSIVASYGQPFNVFPMLYADELARQVRGHVKVALGGNGADEAFGGYRGYNRHLVLDRLASLLARLPLRLGSWSTSAGSIRRIQQHTRAPLEDRRAISLEAHAQELGRVLLTPRFALHSGEFRPGRFIAEYARECSPRDYLDTVMYSDLMVYHQHGTTVITDVSGMKHSVEIRAPFLDHRLLEFAFALPRKWRVSSALRPSRNKYLLKKTLEHVLPREVLYGRKFGFGYSVALPELLGGPWRAVVEAFVRRGRYLELDIFSREGSEWAIRHSPADVWRLLIFAVWAELCVFGTSVEALRGEFELALAASLGQVA